MHLSDRKLNLHDWAVKGLKSERERAREREDFPLIKRAPPPFSCPLTKAGTSRRPQCVAGKKTRDNNAIHHSHPITQSSSEDAV